MNNFNKINNYLNNLLSHQYSTIILSVVIALYAGAIAPALPNKVINFFDTKIGKMIFIFLIAYTSNKNIKFSLILSIAFVVTLCIANNKKIQLIYEKFEIDPDIVNVNELEEEDNESMNNI